MKDATDQPIVIGNAYGYTTTSNGWAVAVVVIGRVRKCREKDQEMRGSKELVTMDVIRRKTFLYGKESEHQKNTSKTVTISPFHLFPVGDES
jgi:hypothetical protein